MSETAILVEGLSKSYFVGHNVAEAESYTALRDVLARGAKNLARKTSDMMRGRAIVQGDVVEEFWALKDLSFEVKRGDRVGIIGRNGAGKSTLLKILSRITEPTRGRISIAGRVASLLEVGTGFHPELTGRENIFLNGAILGMKRREIQKKFDEIVAFAEVEKFLDTPVKRYSSGMYVRLAFSVAAHLEPEILIVDEVLAVGDVQFQKKCLGKMQDVSGDGRTVLFVSHNMAAIEQLTRKILYLSEGRLKEFGQTERVVGAYLRESTSSSKVCFDVEKARRKWPGNQMARILELRFDRQLPVFDFDEDFQFRARVRANADTEEVTSNLTIYSSDGTPVGTSFSAGSASVKGGDEYELSVSLPCPRLSPGQYHCGFAVCKGDVTSGYVDLDVVSDTLQFEVRPLEGAGGTLAHWVRGWGRVVFRPLDLRMEGPDKSVEDIHQSEQSARADVVSEPPLER